jgi:hypothetical protein
MQPLTTTSVAPAANPRAFGWAGALAPSLLDCFFAALVAWIFLGIGAQALLSDGDTGWHIRTGDYIVTTGTVPRVDFFTFTRPGDPWFAWEWLTDLVFSLLHTAWGLKAIALVCGVILCLTTTLTLARMMMNGGNLFIALAGALLTNSALLVHYLARPHVFTFLLLAVSLWILDRDRREPGRAIWLLVPITAVWVNLHGGFLALIACLGLTLIGYAIQWALGDRDRAPFFTRRYTLVGAACGLATLVNPYGYHLHGHIAGYLQSDFVRNHVEEFQSPQFRGESMLQFEILLFASLGMVGLLLARRKFPEALLVLFWAQAALGSVRHAPIFALVAGPIVVEELTALWNRWAVRMPKSSIVGIVRDLGEEFAGKGAKATIWIGVIIAALTVSMQGGDPDRWPKNFPKDKFPIAMVEDHAAMLLPATGNKPRIFTSDQWGDYLSYRFYPRIRIFVDGRSDFWGPELGREYIAMMAARHDSEALLDRHRIDIALIPSQWPLGELLKRSPAWRLVADRKTALLFERRTPVLMKKELSAESSGSTTRGTAR